MAQIPDALPTADVVGYRPSTETVGATDFGLSQTGDMLASMAPARVKAQQQKDAESVTTLAQKFATSSEAAYREDAAAYTGDHPGFANDQLSKAQQRAADYVAQQADLTPGQRRALQHATTEHVNQIGASAGHYEAEKLAAPIAAMTALQQESQAGDVTTALAAQVEPAVQQLTLEHRATDTDLPAKVGAAYDAAQAQALANVPDTLKPFVGQQILKMKLAAQGKALAFQMEQGANHLLQGFTDQVSRAANTVVSAPSGYENARDVLLPQMLATAPAGLRDELERNGQAVLATARVRGLMDHEQFGQALGELNDGRYDKWLKPDEKAQLVARAEAENRAHGPEAFAKAMLAQDLVHRGDADIYARLTTGKPTGQVNLDEMAANLSPQQAAEYATRARLADQTFAATGAVHDMPQGDLQALAAHPPPSPTDAGYADKLTIWQAQQQAAQAEMKARADPGQWAYTASPSKAARPGAGAAQDRGAMLSQGWTSYLGATPGGDRQQAGKLIASRALGAQEAAGFDRGSWQLVPQTEAARLAASVVNAPPEGKLAAMSALAGVIHDLPSAVRTQTGETVSPQAILTRQLLDAHLTAAELSAIVDFGADPAKLGRYVAAVNDPTLKAALPGHQQKNLEAQVKTALQPFLTSVAPLPGAQDLAQARLDRTVTIARGLMAHQGLNPGTAAAQAAKDMTDGYRYVDTWRVPASVAGGLQLSLTGGRSDVGMGVALTSPTAQIRQGAAKLLNGLLSNSGAGLGAAGSVGSPDEQRAQAAKKIGAVGRWVSASDDSGLILMAPHPDGSWDQVVDRYGRPVRASWRQLQGLAQGDPSPFAAPPPNALHVDGKPVAAASKAASFAALAWAVNGRESGFRTGLVSEKGALGPMQVMPATVQTYAPRLGLPVDLDRAQHDDAYNRKIGEAALSDHLQRYGSGAGIGLALAAYNAGQGRVDGYRDPKTHQWHPGWLQTIGDPRSGKISLTDWAAKIPVRETREYVQAVLPLALRRLQSNH